MTVLALLTALLVPLLSTSAARADAASDDWLRRINSLRQANGLNPLQVDPQTTQLAQQRADANANSGVLQHTPDLTAGVTSNWIKLGENVGIGATHDAIWDAFLKSAPHRANLLDPSFTHIGLGETVKNGEIWVTHRFLQLGSAAAPAPLVVAPAPTAARVVAPPTTKRPAATSTTTAPTIAVATPPDPPPAPPPDPGPNAEAVVDALRMLQQ